MICKHVLLITFVNEYDLILFQTVKWFHVLLWINTNSIKYQSLNDKTDLFQKIQFNTYHLFAQSLNVK